jgi:hypothetical protein
MTMANQSTEESKLIEPAKRVLPAGIAQTIQAISEAAEIIGPVG